MFDISTFELSIAFITTIFGIVISLLSLRSLNARLKQQKTEWLHLLYEKYYENDEYREIEEMIEYSSDDEVAILKAAITQENDRVLIRKLDKYLNFFNLIGSMLEQERINIKSIRSLFDYNIRNLKKNPDVYEYMIKYKFNKAKYLLDKIVN